MIYDKIEHFVESLIEKTNQEKIEWNTFNEDDNVIKMIPEIELATGIDFRVNTLALWKSYFAKKNDGYIFLVYLLHGDSSIISSEMSSMMLLVKINKRMQIINLTSYINSEEHQQRLNTLKMILDSFLQEKDCMPDVLYNFMDDFVK